MEPAEQTADVVVEIDGRQLTPALFAVLQPTWIRLGGYVLPLVGAACALRLVPGEKTTAAIVAVAGVRAVRVARHVAASRAQRRALSNRRERVALGLDALVRNDVRIGWEEVTDAAEIDTPMPKGHPIRVIALRARGTWSVLTPVARFERGDYDAARAIVNRARAGEVRVVSL